MKSKIFDHFLARIVLAAMLVWSFLTIYLVIGFGDGEIFTLLIITLRHFWWKQQILAWIGIGLELTALGLVRTRHWRKFAYLGTACLALAAAFFLIPSDDFRFLRLPKVSVPIGIFIVSCILRVMQLRLKPAAPKVVN